MLLEVWMVGTFSVVPDQHLDHLGNLPETGFHAVKNTRNVITSQLLRLSVFTKKDPVNRVFRVLHVDEATSASKSTPASR